MAEVENLAEAIPTIITQRYRVEEKLGEGGFATVYRAWDSQLERQVALKLYHLQEGENVEKLGREAKMLASLSHPNIVIVHDAGIADGRPYIVMAYLAGGSLRDKLGPNKPPMRPRDALALTVVLAEALHAAHEADILHLDIKPENIIFDHRGRPFLTDFGIGRVMGGDGVTRQTRALGSGNYAPPEQRQRGELTRKSDIYSLGVVLFELLTNKLPLGPAPTHPQPPYSPPFLINEPITAAKGLVKLVCRALAVSADYRFESAEEFVQALRSYIVQSGESTGNLLPTMREFSQRPITAVQFREPERALRRSEMRRVPQNIRQMEEDLTPIPPATQVGEALYSHQGVEVGVGSVVEQAVFARGRVRLRQDALVRGDVVSLTMIDVSQGVQAANLIAPEIMVRGPVRLTGSLFCRRLRPAQGESGVHLPENSELGGSLIFGKQFEKIVPDDALGRALKYERPPIEFFGDFPSVTIGSGCTLVAILGDVTVEVAPGQKQLNTIRVSGDVTIGASNTVRRIEGRNVHIGRNCTVDEVHALGTLTIEQGSTVGYMRAEEAIRLSNNDHIAAPILFSDSGAIKEEGEATWSVGKNQQGLTAKHIFTFARGEQRGSMATILLDHRLYELYDRIAPGWLPRLSPVRFTGSGEQVNQPAQPKALPVPSASDEGYLDEQMDLTPASARPSEPEPPTAPAADPPVERRGEHIAVPTAPVIVTAAQPPMPIAPPPPPDEERAAPTRQMPPASQPPTRRMNENEERHRR